MPQILAIVDEGGRNLMVKTLGDATPPSFATVGLLATIASFSDGKGYTVESFGTSNVQIVYKK